MTPFWSRHGISARLPAATQEGDLFVKEAIDAWENEGGLPSESRSPKLVGTELQMKWTEPLAVHINARFDVRNAFESVARKQGAEDRINALVLAVSEDKRGGVAEDGARYPIHEWQALRDQARRMIT
jgi:hypothetical protein